MSLTPGTRLGPYEILSTIGAGGMGEVYRARDTKLNRDVALKILPDVFAHDPDRLMRFTREAQTLAALNHSHIAAIYGLEESGGVRALVMELVEGPTLADRIVHGAIPVDEALPIARQIAEALEAAHELGIIHRDLKPANIKVKADGTVKVLDFGLAKALEPASSAELANSPTITSPALTQQGVILGTAAYMSPEQAKGKPVDKRADVWAFGAVLYEMLTGKRAFAADDISDTLAAVLRADVKFDALPVGIPARVRQVLATCLQRDLKQRAHDIGDVRLALEGAFETTAPQTAAVAVVQPAWRQALPVAAALFVGVVLTGLAAWILWPTADVPRVTRFTIVQPAAQPLSVTAASPVLALSPDGTRGVYRVLIDGRGALVVRPLDALETTVLYRGSASGPFFSPDGAWVGFNDTTDRTIKRVLATGGPALTISAVGAGASALRGATWGADDTIIFGTGTSSGLWQIPAGGGTPTPLTTLDKASGETYHWWPELLPGGKAVLFTIFRAGDTADKGQIVVRQLATGEQRVLLSGGSYPKYVPTGHLVYAFADTLRAVPFDLDQLTVTGNPVAVLAGVSTTLYGNANAAVARDGSLAYVTGTAAAARQLVWFDRNGRRLGTLGEVDDTQESPELSPDGQRVALHRLVQGNLDVWVIDAMRRERYTFDPAGDRFPLWSPDGSQIVFNSLRHAGHQGEYVKPSNNPGGEEVLLAEAPLPRAYVAPTAWSRDGRFILFDVNDPTAGDVWVLPLESREPYTFVNSGFVERVARFSPDGRWVAYQSLETGRSEIYIRPFPGPGGQFRVSTSGGAQPRWRNDGQELYFISPNAELMAASIKVQGSSVVPGAPVALFPTRIVLGGTEQPNRAQYDVARDGRFLINTVVDDDTAQPQIIVVQHWTTELQRLVPSR